tara:strand:- start:47739 stop:47918 length:180 start_codon:yes stop_codon:yes gene_type:complete
LLTFLRGRICLENGSAFENNVVIHEQTGLQEARLRRDLKASHLDPALALTVWLYVLIID